MNIEKITNNRCNRSDQSVRTNTPQNLLVLQQKGSGETKIKGVREHGEGLFNIEVFSIDTPLPIIIDDSHIYLPEDFSADLVLDFLKHPDLSYDLARICHEKRIPVVASGKKLRDKWAITPPT
jgi:hypothetical protein